jgi:uncharacterized protein
MKCVKCDGALVPVRVDEVDVDQCDRCGGVWFDAHEMERVIGRGHAEALTKRGVPRPGDDTRRGRCPRCRGEGYLVQVATHDAAFHVDTCAICGGKWLDGGEIAALDRPATKLRRFIRRVLNFDLG